VILEITRRTILPPTDTSIFSIPEKTDRTLQIYLAPSPGIETTNARIAKLAKEVAAEKENAWEKVETIYDWVRKNVEYREGPFKGALKALDDKKGDCEELTSLFIAMCRVNKIPARTVWVPGHCYAEFYLVDKEGKGHWFPCQAAGTRAFGGCKRETTFAIPTGPPSACVIFRNSSRATP
jgi:transglutaminase-like putative cysteine protease